MGSLDDSESVDALMRHRVDGILAQTLEQKLGDTGGWNATDGRHRRPGTRGRRIHPSSSAACP
jgi:hypothetical protein